MGLNPYSSGLPSLTLPERARILNGTVGLNPYSSGLPSLTYPTSNREKPEKSLNPYSSGLPSLTLFFTFN